MLSHFCCFIILFKPSIPYSSSQLLESEKFFTDFSVFSTNISKKRARRPQVRKTSRTPSSRFRDIDVENQHLTVEFDNRSIDRSRFTAGIFCPPLTVLEFYFFRKINFCGTKALQGGKKIFNRKPGRSFVLIYRRCSSM